jgi:predicted DNA-binding transcriptional regulator AlpA
MQMIDIVPDTKLTFVEWCDLIGVNRVIFAPEDRVMNMKEWAEAAGISLRTARELISTGAGPPVVELSPNRLGIRVCDHRAWLAARTRNIAKA